MFDGMKTVSMECVPYVKQEIPVGRVLSLVELMNKCKQYGIEIEKVVYMQHGFSVMFKGIDGDAVLHDNSYGKDMCEWETYGMPWDYGDVSVHDADRLAWMLHGAKTIPADQRYMLTHHVGMNGYHHEYFADPDKAVERAKFIADKKAVDFRNGEISACDQYQFDHYGSLSVFDRWCKEAIYSKGE